MELKTPISELILIENDLLEIKMCSVKELDFISVKKHFETVREFTANKQLTILLDFRQLQFSHIPIETMDYMANSQNVIYHKAVAILIEGLGQKLLGDFYVKIIKPKAPTKLFTEKSEALIWLKTVNEKSMTNSCMN